MERVFMRAEVAAEDRHLACLGRQASGLSSLTAMYPQQAGSLPAETIWKTILHMNHP
jgi:hypothetical protein